jgi:thiosulfate reductase cytochrome b subunit
MEDSNVKTTHSYIARLAHWLIAICVVVLGASGLEIFNAFPGFGTKLPASMELPVPSFLGLGGWLGGALSWHFTFAMLFIPAVALYAVDLIRGGWRRVWLSSKEWLGIWPMARYYFLKGPKPEVNHLYNPLQKFAYLSMTATFALVIVTGTILAQPVQFGFALRIPAAWQLIRILHFACLCAFASFLPGHLVMVTLAGRPAMMTMLSGRSEVAGIAISASRLSADGVAMTDTH